MDNLNLFWDSQSFQRDGIHPNKLGSHMLLANLQHAVQSYPRNWLYTHTPRLPCFLHSSHLTTPSPMRAPPRGPSCYLPPHQTTFIFLSQPVTEVTHTPPSSSTPPPQSTFPRDHSPYWPHLSFTTLTAVLPIQTIITDRLPRPYCTFKTTNINNLTYIQPSHVHRNSRCKIIIYNSTSNQQTLYEIRSVQHLVTNKK